DEGRGISQKQIPPLRYGMTDEVGDTSGAGDEEDGDVVAAAVSVGGVDEGLADRFERRAGSVHPSEQARWGPRIAAEDAGDGVVVEFAAEAVGGEQEEGAGIDGVGGNVGFDGGVRGDG